MQKTILVTGGTGFIGSHACQVLLEENYKIIVIDSNVNSSPLSLKFIKKIFEKKNLLSPDIYFYKGDIRDERLLQTIFLQAKNSNNPIDGVIHFAGLKSVEESMKSPFKYWDNNVLGTLNLLKVMDIFNCRTIVFSSSATIYGNNSKPLKEDFEIKPINPYGHTKASVEYLLESVFKSDESRWRIANLRYFNPIGAHKSGLIGEDPLRNLSNLFPYICLVAKGKFEILNVFGKDWPTFDGTCVRDYIHVVDLANAHVRTLDYLFDNEPKIIKINIGTGIGTSVLELIHTFQEVNKCEIPYRFCDRRIGDVPTLVADNSRALNLLKWKPYRTIKDMCLDGWNWNTLNPDGYKD